MKSCSRVSYGSTAQGGARRKAMWFSLLLCPLLSPWLVKLSCLLLLYQLLNIEMLRKQLHSVSDCVHCQQCEDDQDPIQRTKSAGAGGERSLHRWNGSEQSGRIYHCPLTCRDSSICQKQVAESFAQQPVYWRVSP